MKYKYLLLLLIAIFISFFLFKIYKLKKFKKEYMLDEQLFIQFSFDDYYVKFAKYPDNFIEYKDFIISTDNENYFILDDIFRKFKLLHSANKIYIIAERNTGNDYINLNEYSAFQYIFTRKNVLVYIVDINFNNCDGKFYFMFKDGSSFKEVGIKEKVKEFRDNHIKEIIDKFKLRENEFDTIPFSAKIVKNKVILSEICGQRKEAFDLLDEDKNLFSLIDSFYFPFYEYSIKFSDGPLADTNRFFHGNWFNDSLTNKTDSF